MEIRLENIKNTINYYVQNALIYIKGNVPGTKLTNSLICHSLIPVRPKIQTWLAATKSSRILSILIDAEQCKIAKWIETLKTEF